MGSSLAAAIKEKNLAKEILFLVTNSESQKLIEALNFRASLNYSDLHDSNIVFIAAPLASYVQIFDDLSQLNFSNEVIISDLGSVKANLIKIAKKRDKNLIFVPAHPIAGSEKSGTAKLVKNLYLNKKVIITEEQNQYNKKIAGIWQELGAKIEYMAPETHDKIYGYISHLVQNIAFKLNYLFYHSRQDIASLRESYADENFNKFTRLYFSNKKIWQDIFTYNQTYLNEAIAFTHIELEKLIFECDKLAAEQDKYEISKFNTKILDNILANLVAKLVKKIITTQINNYKEYAGSGFNDFVAIAEHNQYKLEELNSVDIGYIRDRLANLLNYLH